MTIYGRDGDTCLPSIDHLQARRNPRPGSGVSISFTYGGNVLLILIHSVKDHAKEQGGEIGHEYSLIKGFA